MPTESWRWSGERQLLISRDNTLFLPHQESKLAQPEHINKLTGVGVSDSGIQIVINERLSFVYALYSTRQQL